MIVRRKGSYLLLLLVIDQNCPAQGKHLLALLLEVEKRIIIHEVFGHCASKLNAWNIKLNTMSVPALRKLTICWGIWTMTRQ